MKISKEETEEILQKISPEIRIIAKKYFISGGSEDDLFQEGLLGVSEGILSYDESRGDVKSDSFKKFLYMCAKRQIIDAVKSSNSKKNLPLNSYISFTQDDGNEMTEYKDLEPVSYNPEDVMLDKLELEEKQTTINVALSIFEKEILNLYLDGLKQSEIASKLNRPIKQIDNILQKIKNKLRTEQKR